MCAEGATAWRRRPGEQLARPAAPRLTMPEEAVLARRLELLGLPAPARIRVNDNRTVMVSFTRGGLLSIHRGYALAPDRVLKAVVRFLKPRLSREARRAAEREILAFRAADWALGEPRRRRAGDRPRRGEFLGGQAGRDGRAEQRPPTKLLDGDRREKAAVDAARVGDEGAAESRQRAAEAGELPLELDRERGRGGAGGDPWTPINHIANLSRLGGNILVTQSADSLSALDARGASRGQGLDLRERRHRGVAREGGEQGAVRPAEAERLLERRARQEPVEQA